MDSIDPQLRIDSVTLGVSELQRSTDFYERVLGLGVSERSADEAVLGPGRTPQALRLLQLEDAVLAPPGSTGLFHVAWLHPSRAGLADTVRRVLASDWRIDGASDHGVSEALYLSDPDGLGIEIYADRPRERWERGPDGQGVSIVTLPLDLESLMSQSPGEPGPAIEPGTVIGHVHLKVSDVERAAAFYGAGLGFQEMARIPSAAFLSAGGYHHHIGLNSWQSQGSEPAPAHAPGLQAVDFRLGGPSAVQELAHRAADSEPAARVENGGAGVALRDPDGQLLRFAAA